MTADRLGAHDGQMLASDWRPTKNSGYNYRPVWRFKKGANVFLRGLLETCPKPVLNVPCGSSKLGDIRADLYHPAADLRADMEKLPLEDDSVGTVLCDPPWGIDPARFLPWISEFKRVIRYGGNLLWYAPWTFRSAGLRVEGIWSRELDKPGIPRPPVLCIKFVRVRE